MLPPLRINPLRTIGRDPSFESQAIRKLQLALQPSGSPVTGSVRAKPGTCLLPGSTGPTGGNWEDEYERGEEQRFGSHSRAELLSSRDMERCF